MSNKGEYSDSDFEPVMVADEDTVCNYCNRRTPLMQEKPYCARCHSMMYRECKRCHKPFHLQRYFEKDELRCNACFEKLQKERMKRAMKKQKVDTAIDDDDDDPFMASPPKPKRKPVAPKQIPPASSPAAASASSPAAQSASSPAAANNATIEGKPVVLGAPWDLKDAKMVYIPVFFK